MRVPAADQSSAHSPVPAIPSIPRAERGAELKAMLELERLGSSFIAWRPPGEQLQLTVLGTEVVTIGRGTGCTIEVSWDSSVSRMHALIESLGNTWFLRDDGISKNGTYLSGERVVGSRSLADRDVIKAGDAVLLFCGPAGSATTRTSAGSGGVDIASLTKAERKVLAALAGPFMDSSSYAAPATNAEIADALILSTNTIKTHLANLVEKFELREVPRNEKRIELVRRAAALGLLRDTGE